MGKQDFRISVLDTISEITNREYLESERDNLGNLKQSEILKLMQDVINEKLDSLIHILQDDEGWIEK